MNFAVVIGVFLLVCAAAQETPCGKKTCTDAECCVRGKGKGNNNEPRCHPMAKQNTPCSLPNQNETYEKVCPCESGFKCTEKPEGNSNNNKFKLRCTRGDGTATETPVESST
uniref:GTx3-3 n=1 Tax=Grammostola rosea TaxID=432528 RepID=M5AWV3_GRARO|nr:GTx3-3 [Grammostola rosea]